MSARSKPVRAERAHTETTPAASATDRRQPLLRRCWQALSVPSAVMIGTGLAWWLQGSDAPPPPLPQSTAVASPPIRFAPRAASANTAKSRRSIDNDTVTPGADTVTPDDGIREPKKTDGTARVGGLDLSRFSIRRARKPSSQSSRGLPPIDERPIVRLNFLNSPWKSVLESVAEQSQSVLVVDRVPAGRFTRVDPRKYTRAEAVRILNNELEPLGFRILEREHFLVVLHLDSLRTRYPAARLASVRGESSGMQRVATGAAASTTVTSDDGPTASKIEPIRSGRSPYHRKVATLRPAEPSDAGSGRERTGLQFVETPIASSPAAGRAWHGRDSAPSDDRSDIRLVQHTRPADGSADTRTAPIRRVTEVFSPRHKTVEVVTEELLRTFFGGAEGLLATLTTPSPDGTPVILRDQRSGAVATPLAEPPTERTRFRIVLPIPEPTDEKGEKNSTRPAAGGRIVSFDVAIDPQGRKISVTGTAAVTGEVIRLLNALDTADGDVRTEPVRVHRSPERTAALAHQLQNIATRLAAYRRQREAAGDGAARPRPDAANTGGAPAQPESASGPANDTADGQPPAGESQPSGAPSDGERGEGQQRLPDLVGQLKGDVSVESMEDLGVLIIRGGKEDVERVLRVIQQIEQLSVGTAPDVHLRPLKYVNSESLAELLTTVYERLATARGRVVQQTNVAAFYALSKPNALLIVASARDLESIGKLIDQLDRPVDPNREFEVFRLRNAIASQVAQILTDFYDDRPGLGPRVRVVSDARTNAIIVQAAPTDLWEIRKIIERIDRPNAQAVHRIHVYPLRNAVAEELADVLNQALQSALSPPGTGVTAGTGITTGGASQQLREVRSAVLELFAEKDGKLLRSGLLADIRITAEPRSNSLIVLAPPESQPLLAELIRQFDRPSQNVAEIKHFTLQNADASDVAELLTELFINQTGDQPQGIQLAGATGSGEAIIPLKVSVDTRTNSILAVGGADTLRVVEAIVLRLDEADIQKRQTAVIRLKNSPAADVADAINQFLQSQRDLAQADPNLVSAFEQMQREIIVVPETVTNSLLISATPRYYTEITDMITKLDAPPPQVLIQALLVEVQLDNTDEFGVELGFQDSVLFDRSLLSNIQTVSQIMQSGGNMQTIVDTIVSQEGQPGFLFNSPILGNNTGNPNAHPGKVGKQALSNFQLGRINSDLGFGGLVLTASSESVSVLLRALSAKRHVEILSRPQIRTLDNQLAQIQVGQEVPRINGFTTSATTGVASPLVEQSEAGIILTVTPRISPDGMVVMEVIAEKSQFSGDGVDLFTDTQTGTVIRSPIKDITTARTTVSVANNQTIVLGGMITKTEDTIERKVPWLGDIPILGIPFRFDSTTTQRKELLIFLTPRIVRSDEESELIKQIEIERLNFSHEQAEQMHGPLFAVPQDFEAAPAHPPAAPPAPEGAVIQPPRTFTPARAIPAPAASERAARPVPAPRSSRPSDAPPKPRPPARALNAPPAKDHSLGRRPEDAGPLLNLDATPARLPAKAARPMDETLPSLPKPVLGARTAAEPSEDMAAETSAEQAADRQSDSAPAVRPASAERAAKAPPFPAELEHDDEQ